MKSVNKKYFSISEVSEITGFPTHKLRYLEKSKTGMEIFQIRGRRYYTLEDIESIKQKFTKKDDFQLNLFIPQAKNNTQNLILQSNLIIKINDLIAKLTKLEQTTEVVVNKLTTFFHTNTS